MKKEREFRYYPAERLEISSIDSRLTKDEKMARRFLMNYTIDNNKPYNLKEDLNTALFCIRLSENRLEELFKNLIDKNAIVTDEENNVNFIYPVSAIETNHKVTLEDGREFNAMCAIDSIGTAFTFNQDVEIQSICSNTGRPIKIKVEDGQLKEVLPRDMSILHVDLKKTDNWSGSC